MVDENAIDNFLNQLGHPVGKTEDDVRKLLPDYIVTIAVFSFNNRYSLNLYIEGKVNLSEFRGEIVLPEYTPAKMTLPDLCNLVEESLEEVQIKYNRDVQVKPTEAHRKVSYELLPHPNDKGNRILLRDLDSAIFDIMKDSGYSRGGKSF